ncbi:MAG: protein kinase domain-containing protein [bacterium]
MRPTRETPEHPPDDLARAADSLLENAADLFSAALELPPPERSAYLDRACPGNAALRDEVESLLRAHTERAPGFLQHPPEMTSSGTLLSELLGGAAAGTLFGSYRIERQLATGGMGAVYLAERVDDAYHKHVAIKLIHPSLWGSEAIQRFRQERQVLADLEHPGIARLIDGGSTSGELPYLVMEYVDGVPITSYCDERGLEVEKRLTLFLDVCDAVLYAHQNLVIHRDLKPGNILVDRSGRVKLLDFGIAKVLDPAGAPVRDDLTTTRLPFTPRYASPEQVLGGRITTATDIYGLGLVLYELLTGHHPYDLDSKSHTQIVRAIATEEPVRPSRRADAPGARPLDGDIDVILLKALHKDPARRYGTVEEFAADIRRRLSGLPVLARPDTAGYRMRKFVARNKALVVTACAVVAIVIAAHVTTLNAYRHATSAQREAEWQAYVASLAAAEAAIRADQTEEAASYLEAAPANLRAWEWRHLRARIDRSFESFRAHDKGITQIAALPDGERLITSSIDSTLVIWKGMSGERIRTFGPFASEVESFAPVPGTEQIAVGLNTGRVLLVDASNGATTEFLSGGPSWAFVAVSPDGSRLACGFFDGSVRVWSLPDAALVADWKAHIALAFPAYSPDGKLLATGGGDGSVTLYDARSLAKLRDLPPQSQRVYRLAFNPDASLLVTASMDRTVNVWDVARGTLVHTFRGHDATVSAIAFDSNGYVATAAGDNRLLRWRGDTGAVAGQLRGHLTKASALAAHPDGSHLVSGDWGGTVKSWTWSTADVRTLRIATDWLIPQVHDAVWDPEEKKFAGISNANYFRVWSRSGDAVRDFVSSAPARCALFSPDGSVLAVGNDLGEILVFGASDTTASRLVHAHEGPILGMALNPRDSTAATASGDSKIKLWRIPEFSEFGVIEGHEGAVHDVEFSPAGDVLVSAGADGTMRFWDAGSGRSAAVIHASDAEILDIAFDSAGERLAAASRTGAVNVWDAATRKLLMSLGTQASRMHAVAWSRDGTRIAVGGSDALIRIYEAASGREVMRLHAHVSAITSLRFGRDDAMLTSTAMDGTVRIWDTGPS